MSEFEYEDEFDYTDPADGIDFEEARPEPGPPPDERPLSPEQWDFDYSQRSAAVAQVEAETNQQERLDYVAERADGFGNQQVYARVDELVTAAQGEVYTRLMATGYTEWQAREELASLDYDPLIDQALQQERYLAMTENTSLGEWRRGREADAQQRAREGKPPLPSFYDSPAWQRMAAASERYLARQREWQEGAMAAYKRQVGL